MANRMNITDWERVKAENSALYQMIYNGATRISKVERGVDFTTPYYIGLNVPAGRELFIFYRSLTLSEGDYDIDVINPSGGFTGGTVAYKSTLRADATEIVESDLYMGVTVSGTEEILDQDFVDTGSTGFFGQAGGAPSIEGVFVSVVGQSCLRITKQGGGTGTVGIRLIAWENDV